MNLPRTDMKKDKLFFACETVARNWHSDKLTVFPGQPPREAKQKVRQSLAEHEQTETSGRYISLLTYFWAKRDLRGFASQPWKSLFKTRTSREEAGPVPSLMPVAPVGCRITRDAGRRASE